MNDTKSQIIKLSAYWQDQVNGIWRDNHSKDIDPKLTAGELPKGWKYQ